MGKVKGRRYVPERGDVVWTNSSPQSGHEQKGFRPGVVLTPRAYNKRSGLAIVCPITSQRKGYPFEIPVNVGKISGVALVDHVKSLDISSRGISYLGSLDKHTLGEIVEIVQELIG
jgi:mRNA interferase MazF